MRLRLRRGCAIGTAVVGFSFAVGGKGLGAREAHVHKDIVEGIDSAADGEVAVIALQFEAGEMQCGE